MVTSRFDNLEVGFYHLLNLSDTEVVIPSGIKVLFVDLAVGAENRSTPLSLAESWAIATGLYLFLPKLPTNLAAALATLRSQLQELRRAPAYHQVRFLWIGNVEESLDQWQLQSLSVERDLAGDRINRLAALDLGDYALTLPRGATIALEETGFVVTTDLAT